MKDFLGKELYLNDKVVFIAPSYRLLVIGTIIKFTPLKVRVSYKNNWNNSGEGVACEIIQEPNQLVKI